MHKITVQYFDPADGDDFETAYRERHVPLVQAVPGLERFTISLPDADGAPYLVAELWFADGDALSTAQTSAEMAVVRADSATYDVARRAISTAPFGMGNGRSDAIPLPPASNLGRISRKVSPALLDAQTARPTTSRWPTGIPKDS